MSNYFFKNRNPKRSVYVPEISGYVEFEAIDAITGVFVTTRDPVAEMIRRLSRSASSNVQEITAEEYAELKKKQEPSPGSKRIWREELSPGRKQGDTVSPLATKQVKQEHAASTNPVPVTEEARKDLETSEVPEALKPKTRKVKLKAKP